MDYTGEIIIVTGAARGMGRACSESLLRKGAIVYLIDRDGTGRGNKC